MVRILSVLACLTLAAGCLLPETSATEEHEPSPTWTTTTIRKTPSPGPSEIPSDAIPVVRWISFFSMTDQRGAPWAPQYPGYHGCSDTFTIDKKAERVEIMDFNESGNAQMNPDAAQAFVAEQLREPDEYYRNSKAMLPAHRPWTYSLEMGNQGAEPVPVWLNSTKLVIGATELIPGDEKTFQFEYEWKRDDGTVLNVKENLFVTHYGIWNNPIRLVAPQYCL